ncbi:MAG: hypothetical protein WC285_00775 [Candidatus Gracilibacteria bacterium]|jgi:hypothetical protein
MPDNFLPEEPLKSSVPSVAPTVTPAAPPAPVTTQEPTSISSSSPTQEIGNPEKILEQLSTTQTTAGKKLPMKMILIVAGSILILGGAVAAYILFSSEPTPAEQENTTPPTITNPLVPETAEPESDVVTPDVVTPDIVTPDIVTPDATTPDGPPSIEFPTTPPPTDELQDTVDSIQENTDAAANVMDTPVIEDVPATDKVSR